ncbi:MAG: class I SAM-dependent methyltransferase [Candidatus Thorarchaeota archaeon]
MALIRQFTGINTGGGQVHGSLITIFKGYVKKKLSPRTIQFLRKLHAHMTRKKLYTLPVLPDNASSQLKTLLKAWKVAQESDANAPGQHLAYYSLALEGYYFPGERPWIDRWNNLRSITDYSGKRILELGCNMCLLSTYLLKDSNVQAALAVDIDAKILESAKLINMAFDVKPVLKVQNFDAPEDWESQLIDFKPDIVFALNVLNWVGDKKRLLNFLGHFQEVIFEGHDSFAIESQRLIGIGFKKIDIVGVSERGREVLHCRKYSN